MLILDFISWWYSKGLIKYLSQIKHSLSKIIDYFSISILLKTLFHPFKLIANYQTGRDLASKIGAWGDRMVSRMVGFVIRFVTLLIALVTIILALIVSCFRIVFWLILPLLPVMLAILFAMEIKL